MTPQAPNSVAARRLRRPSTHETLRAPVDGRPLADRPVERPALRDADRNVQFVSSSDHRIVPRPRSEQASRIVNIALAILILIALSPVLLLIGLAIWMTSPGPILYTQTRIGIDRRRRPDSGEPYDRRMRDLGGRVFRIYKFRSMYVDAERRSGAVWASANDPRVTPVGRFLRKCRLDELPQLFNVLRGDMNIVGPRPERPSIFARLRDGIPEYPLRQLAKPGITGWAQVNQSYDACLEDVRRKVGFDLQYIQRQSVVEDMRILLRTVPVVLFRRGGW